jgi:hypothetical protein
LVSAASVSGLVGIDRTFPLLNGHPKQCVQQLLR